VSERTEKRTGERGVAGKKSVEKKTRKTEIYDWSYLCGSGLLKK